MFDYDLVDESVIIFGNSLDISTKTFKNFLKFYRCFFL